MHGTCIGLLCSHCSSRQCEKQERTKSIEWIYVYKQRNDCKRPTTAEKALTHWICAVRICRRDRPTLNAFRCSSFFIKCALYTVEPRLSGSQLISVSIIRHGYPAFQLVRRMSDNRGPTVFVWSGLRCFVFQACNATICPFICSCACVTAKECVCDICSLGVYVCCITIWISKHRHTRSATHHHKHNSFSLQWQV